jgi:small subunit ribosomal protein S21
VNKVDQGLKEVGISVVARGNEDIESMIRRFKKKVNKTGILKDLRKKDYYMKPSIAKRRKSAEAKKRLERELQKELEKKSKKYYRKGDKNEKNSSSK